MILSPRSKSENLVGAFDSNHDVMKQLT
jgi:hypothetical protein